MSNPHSDQWIADLRNQLTRSKWGDLMALLRLPILSGVQYSPQVKRINEGTVVAAYEEVRKAMLITGDRADIKESEILAWLTKDSPGLGPDDEAPGLSGSTPRTIAAELIRTAQTIAEMKAAGSYVESERYRDDRLEIERIARGELEFVFRYEDDEPDEKPPTAAQAAAIRHLQDNEASIVSSVVAAMAAQARGYAADLQSNANDPKWAAAICPTDLTDEQMRDRMRADGVTVTDRKRDGMGYLELLFTLAWDSEHQYYVVTHGNLIVGIFDSGEGWSDE